MAEPIRIGRSCSQNPTGYGLVCIRTLLAGCRRSSGFFKRLTLPPDAGAEIDLLTLPQKLI